MLQIFFVQNHVNEKLYGIWYVKSWVTAQSVPELRRVFCIVGKINSSLLFYQTLLNYYYR